MSEKDSVSSKTIVQGPDSYSEVKLMADAAYFKTQQFNIIGNHSNQQIENNFSYHAPKEGQPAKYEALRNKAKELAYLMDELCIGGLEKSLAMTKLEEAVMWANASIARN